MNLAGCSCNEGTHVTKLEVAKDAQFPTLYVTVECEHTSYTYTIVSGVLQAHIEKMRGFYGMSESYKGKAYV